MSRSDTFSALSLLSTAAMQTTAAKEILECNKHTGNYGLTLSPQDALRLCETRDNCLKACGRIEFNGSAVTAIIREFCGSPWLAQDNYLETLEELLEIFYTLKNETCDLFCDSELIELMYDCFHFRCHGSLELLKDREVDVMIRLIRGGARRFRLLGHARAMQEYYFREGFE